MIKFVKIIGIFSLLMATVANAGTIDNAQRMLNQLGYAAGVVEQPFLASSVGIINSDFAF